MSFRQLRQSLVFLAFFLDHTPGNQVLELFISTEAEHFFSTTDGVAFFESSVNSFEEIVKSEEAVIISQHVNDFICYVIRDAARETSSFRSSHVRIVPQLAALCDLKIIKSTKFLIFLSYRDDKFLKPES